MRLSSGLRHALSEAGTWVVVAAIGVGAVIWFDEITAGIASALGRPVPESIAAAEAAPERTQAGSVELSADRRGHFTANALINGRPVPVLVDTGASMVALSYEDAQRAGVYVRPGDFTARVRTANGIARIAPVVLDSVSIGDIELRNVDAAVSEPGRLGTTLLGMTFIGRLGRAELRSGVLILEQ